MPTANKETLIRIVTMLQLVPVFPKWVTARELHNILEKREFKVTKRTVERNLQTFADVFGLVNSDSPDGFKWSYAKESNMGFLPAMSIEEALSLKMAQQHLQLHMPYSVFESLDCVFNKAADVLQKQTTFGHWYQKIAVIPAGLNVQTMQISQNTADVIYSGILENRVVKIRYNNKDRLVRLLGLIIRNNKLVIPCQEDSSEKVIMILAHRIEKAELTSISFEQDFDVKKYVSSGAPSYLISKEEVELTLNVKGYVLTLLSESEIGKNQVVEPINDTWSLCKVNVRHTYELEQWLQSHIQDIQILAPESVKQNVRKNLQEGLALFSS